MAGIVFFLSWFGWCSILKMSILPKFLYLLDSLPIHIPMSYLRLVQSTFTRFVWAHKRPRLRYRILTAPKSMGGVALQDVAWYRLACHLSRWLDWCKHGSSKLWVQLEQSVSPMPLEGLRWCFSVDLTDLELRQHPMIWVTLKLCGTTVRTQILGTTPSTLYPKLGNPVFPPGILA